jgi:hypothetical protein
MKTKRRSMKRKNRRTKRGGISGLAAKAMMTAKTAGISAAHLGLSVVNFGSSTLNTGSKLVESGQIIVNAVGITSLNLSNAVSSTLVGSSFTINKVIRGFFGLNLLICKSILVSSRLADLILNNILALLSEDESILKQIHYECKSTLNGVGTNQLHVIGPKQCMDKYITFLKKIHIRYIKTCLDMRKRMLKRIKNIFLLIKLKMIQIGCKKYWFSDKYSCKEKIEGKSYYFFQKTKNMTTLNTVNEKIVEFGKMYHRLNSEYKSTIQSIFDANVEPCKDSYSILLGKLKTYTGEHPNDYAYAQIQDFRNKFTELKFELELTEGVEGARGTTLSNVVNFLDLLNKHISEKETEEYHAELEKRQKIKNDIEIEKMKQEQEKIEQEQSEKQKEFEQMTEDVKKIPDDDLIKTESSDDTKLNSQSNTLEAEFKEQYNHNSSENTNGANIRKLYNNSSPGS